MITCHLLHTLLLHLVVVVDRIVRVQQELEPTMQRTQMLAVVLAIVGLACVAGNTSQLLSWSMTAINFYSVLAASACIQGC